MRTESTTWPIDVATARAVSDVLGMTREQLIARITYRAAGATTDGLRDIAVAAMLAPQRPLDSVTLAEEQRAREVPTGLAAVIGRWPGDESDEQVEAALEAIS